MYHKSASILKSILIILIIFSFVALPILLDYFTNKRFSISIPQNIADLDFNKIAEELQENSSDVIFLDNEEFIIKVDGNGNITEFRLSIIVQKMGQWVCFGSKLTGNQISFYSRRVSVSSDLISAHHEAKELFNDLSEMNKNIIINEIRTEGLYIESIFEEYDHPKPMALDINSYILNSLGELEQQDTIELEEFTRIGIGIILPENGAQIIKCIYIQSQDKTV